MASQRGLGNRTRQVKEKAECGQIPAKTLRWAGPSRFADGKVGRSGSAKSLPDQIARVDWRISTGEVGLPRIGTRIWKMTGFNVTKPSRTSGLTNAGQRRDRPGSQLELNGQPEFRLVQSERARGQLLTTRPQVTRLEFS
ncbi:hypothetical protein AAE478_004443 [Parahypoxylon ruwenzoriense]